MQINIHLAPLTRAAQTNHESQLAFSDVLDQNLQHLLVSHSFLLLTLRFALGFQDLRTFPSMLSALLLFVLWLHPLAW